MDFGSSKSRRINRKIRVDGERYPHALQFYSIPPTDNITLQDFEDYAAERVKVLKAVESVGIQHVKGTEAYKDAMTRELKKSGMKSLAKNDISRDAKITENDVNDRKQDHISHFILRLAYCKSEESKRWFIQQECDLFRYRFLQESVESIRQFLDINKLKYTPISNTVKETVVKQLVDSSKDREMSRAKVEATDYFKVLFTEVPELVRSRRIYINKGHAYVPYNDLVLLILGVFRSNLSHALAVASRALPNLEEDGRLIASLAGITTAYLGESFTTKKAPLGVVTADMVDEYSKKSFPLCMQQVHQSLRQNHHLKHGGRMQYGLFLKAIGMTLDEAMKFWRAEFTKIIDGDKFDKQYSYNIRHNYGKEGKRQDYTPYNCMKIIMSNTPGPGDSHGCPFKHSDVNLLQQRLESQKITKDNVKKVVDYVKHGHYQVACATYFKITHNIDENSNFNVNIQHPNQYFEDSQKVSRGEHKTEAPQGKVTKVPLRSLDKTNASQLSQRSKQKGDFDDDDDDLTAYMDTMENTKELDS